jgi:hypothetical protein
MSDEERAKKEKELNMKAATEKYKADMFAWSANCIMASAQAAMAVLNALSSAPPPANYVMAALAGVVGAMQVAAVISAEPKPPRFHSGGQVQGRAGQEVYTNLQGKEVVMTNRQFQNTTQAFANMAQMKVGGNQEPKVQIFNNASDTVKATPRFDSGMLKVIIDKTVNDSFASGVYDMGIAMQSHHARGDEITSW